MTTLTAPAPPKPAPPKPSIGVRPSARAEFSFNAREIHFIPSDRQSTGSETVPNPGELFEGRLLDAFDEAAAFWRMNRLKQQAAQLQKELQQELQREFLSPAFGEQTRRLAGSHAGEIDRLLREAQSYRNGLACVFMRLAISIARQFVNEQYPFEELLSEASLTLLQAIENFNADFGFRFSTYATRAIRRNLYRHIIKKRKQRLQETAAEQLDDAPDHRSHEQADVAVAAAAAEALHGMLGRLRQRDEYIVRRRFGLYQDLPPCTLQSVADELGVTRERVRQIEGRALRKLRGFAEEAKLEELLEA